MMRTFFAALTALLLAAPVQAQYQPYVDMPVEGGSGGGEYWDWNTYTVQAYGGGPGRIGCAGGAWYPGYYVFSVITFNTPYGPYSAYGYGWEWGWYDHGMLDVNGWAFDWECNVDVYLFNGVEWFDSGWPGRSVLSVTAFEGSIPYRRGLFTSRQGACNQNGQFYDGFWPYYREGYCSAAQGCSQFRDTIERCTGDVEYLVFDYRWTGLGQPINGLKLSCSTTAEYAGSGTPYDCRQP